MSGAAAREARIAAVVTGVLRQALVDAGASGIVIVDATTPEAALLRRWLLRAGGAGRVLDEHQPGALVADAANKTTLLLQPVAREAALLPLGDLYASQVAELGDGCSLDGPARDLAARCGLACLDMALSRCVEERQSPEQAFAALGAHAPELANAWRRARFARGRLGLVPKLSVRTLGIDLYA